MMMVFLKLTMLYWAALALGVAHARLFAVPGRGPPLQRWQTTDDTYTESIASPTAAIPQRLGPVQQTPSHPSLPGSGTVGYTALAFAGLLGAGRVTSLSMRSSFMQSTTPRALFPQGGPLHEKETRSRLPRSVSHGPSWYALSTSRKGRSKLRMDLGMQIDPVASAASLSIMAGLGAFLMKIAGLSGLRERRDSEAETG